MKYIIEAIMNGCGKAFLKIEKINKKKQKRTKPITDISSIREKKEERFSEVFSAMGRFLKVKVVPEVMRIIIRTLNVIITAT